MDRPRPRRAATAIPPAAPKPVRRVPPAGAPREAELPRMGPQQVRRCGAGSAAEEFAFGAVPVFLGRAVPPAASLPVGVGEAGDFLMGRGQSGNGWWSWTGIATWAADLGSGAGMGHGSRHHSYNRSRRRMGELRGLGILSVPGLRFRERRPLSRRPPAEPAHRALRAAGIRDRSAWPVPRWRPGVWRFPTRIRQRLPR